MGLFCMCVCGGGGEGGGWRVEEEVRVIRGEDSFRHLILISGIGINSGFIAASFAWVITCSYVLASI